MVHVVVGQSDEVPVVYDEKNLLEELRKDEVDKIVLGADVVLTESLWPGERQEHSSRSPQPSDPSSSSVK
jgi:hypothetical protein